MARAWRLELGAVVQCTDGVYGELRRVVIDPPRSVVTHLVVEQRHRTGLGRLVPIDLMRETNGGIMLDCGREAVEHLPPAGQVVVPGAQGGDGIGDQPTSMAFYGVDSVGYELASEVVGNPATWVRDIVPEGEVEVAPHERVRTTDGLVGRLRGVVVDDQHRVTQLLLHEGHLWGKREIAIPMESIESVDGDIRLGT
jgi:sporulation protein YlmC with PRC-barrel domain